MSNFNTSVPVGNDQHVNSYLKEIMHVHMYSLIATKAWWNYNYMLPLNGRSSVHKRFCQFLKIFADVCWFWSCWNLSRHLESLFLSVKRSGNRIEIGSQTVTLYVVECPDLFPAHQWQTYIQTKSPIVFHLLSPCVDRSPPNFTLRAAVANLLREIIMVRDHFLTLPQWFTRDDIDDIIFCISVLWTVCYMC